MEEFGWLVKINIRFFWCKRLNEISSQGRCECQCYEHIDICNAQRVNVINQMIAITKEDDEQPFNGL